MIVFAVAAFSVLLACAIIGAVICVRSLRAAVNAGQRLRAHELFKVLRSAQSLRDPSADSARRLANAVRQFGVAGSTIVGALGALAGFTASVDLIAADVEGLLNAFVPDLRGAQGR